MNTNMLKKLAIAARRTLRTQVAARAKQLGLGNAELKKYVGGIGVGKQVTDVNHRVYASLQQHFEELQAQHGSPFAALESLTDEVAYTWFNRFTALRFLEANGYHRRTLSSSLETGTDPDALRDAYDLAASGTYPGITPADLERERQAAEKNNRPPDGAVYRLALIGESRALRTSLPCLFDGKPYLELFLPDTLLIADSVTRALASVPDEDWRDIEIIGWLYQFYISEEKDRVMAAKGKYRPQDIPAATQLFTPHWIVRYLIENSLGRTWLEAHPKSGLRQHMPYYLEPHADNPPPAPKPRLEPQDLTLLDPACGSGHLLVYAFDLLTQMYLEYGHHTRDIPALILKHNLHGLDIDPRAAQLASFAVLMKARALNPRILRDSPALNITAVQPTRHLRLEYAEAHPAMGIDASDWQPLLEAFNDADTLGSLVHPPTFEAKKLEAQVTTLELSGSLFSSDAPTLRAVLKQAHLLRQRYTVVMANPPYMGGGSFDDTLKNFVERRYARSKNDLFAVFMERCLEFTQDAGRMATINQHSWMFLSSYEALRKHTLETTFIQSMAHLGAKAFPEIGGEVVQSTAFVIQNRPPHSGERGDYVRLVDAGDSSEKAAAMLEAVKNSECGYRFAGDARDFGKIPGSPVAYWASKKIFNVFSTRNYIEASFSASEGIKTASNDSFLRCWYEVNSKEVGKSWNIHHKGGEFKRWFGNVEYVIEWSNEGRKIKEARGSNLQGLSGCVSDGAIWSDVTSGRFSARLKPAGDFFDSASPCAFSKADTSITELLSYLNSAVVDHLSSLLNPTLHFKVGNFKALPYTKLRNSQCHTSAQLLISLARADWDNFETSWDFQTHPLLRGGHLFVSSAFGDWESQSEIAFRELQRLEVENNRYWIKAYGLEDELTPDVPDDQVTIRRADLTRDVRSLVSFAVGCMMGRYSLDAPGLIFAGGVWDASCYRRFAADPDGILPITDAAYFEDDLTVRFVAFVREAFGEATFGANLEFIANALGRGVGESALEAIRGYFLVGFSRDHHRVYKKRPIYWRFSSGKRNAFNALVYLHRITPDTLSRLRTKYVLPLLGKLAQAIEAEEVLERAGGAAGWRAAARARRLREQLTELRAYQDHLQHKADKRIAVDLDDGVAYNYTLFEGLVYDGADLKLEDLRKRSQWKRDLLAASGEGAV